ncbi:MAG: transcriptional regulator [Alteromonadaceae bacterium]|uniref:Predicted transcription regulator containing HTH domain n=1 Tax=Paraglaciecola agarilytica NO2 TaxID=1125747 RepID=A0ABQ0I1X7_9ALTE|nr:transcriptional regulator [Paraglaciecola agarilytica]MBN24525.1 transcriptional regulator [Alteromonadaceae bacterium]GAC03331.1 predicted transcription regulator containing HTH domain [Paraglaciecola agarilytica NO2]|tara:strand:+ start:30077 stop:30502 length:426 start_codon:yes stop_codon:yes gene_type:complete
MLAIKEVTKLAAGLNAIAPFMREIHSDNELEQALELMEALIEDYDTNLVVIEALGNAITRFENTASSFAGFNRSVNESDPAVGTLKVLMEQYNLNTNDFEHEIGKKSMVSQVLSGGKFLSRKHIELLSKRFNISPALFFGV